MGPEFLEPWALLLDQQEVAEVGVRAVNMALPFLSSRDAGGSRKAVIPGLGYSPNLASAVSFRIFSYYGERRSSGGARALSPAPCPWPRACGKECAGAGGKEGNVQGGWEAAEQTSLGVIRLSDSGVLGTVLTSIPCPRSSFSTWLHSSRSFTEDWKGIPCFSQTDPPYLPSFLGDR